MEQGKLQYNGDLVLADEEENNTTSLDKIILRLHRRLSNEITWETELYNQYFFLQTSHLEILSGDDPPVAERLLQHIMKTVAKIPKEELLYTCFPPIVSKMDKRISDGIETAPEWLNPIKEGVVINDIVYAVNDPGFWTNVIATTPREVVRAQLVGYNLFSDSDFMLPYLLVEDKRHGGGSEYAKAYLTLIAASILHQRLKLRAIGKMNTKLSCPELIVHYIVMVGSEAEYIRVGLRGPQKDRPAGKDDLYFVRYYAEVRGVFQLTRWKSRNQFKSLLRMIHAFGIGSHHEMQKLEVQNAVETWKSVIDGNGNNANINSIKSVDTAFHCVPIEGQKGEYSLQYTDITVNCQKRDDLVPDDFEDDFEDDFADDFEANFEDDFEANFEDDFEDSMNQGPKGNPKRSASTKRKALAKPKKGPAKRPYTKSLKQPKKAISYKELGDDEEEAPDPKRRTREPKKAVHYGV